MREKTGRGPLSTRERMATRDHRWPQGITYGHCARHSDVVGPRIRRCTHQRRARGSPVATGDHHLMTHSREMLGPRGCAYFAGHAPRMATRDHRWSQGITYGRCARLSEFPLAPHTSRGTHRRMERGITGGHRGHVWPFSLQWPGSKRLSCMPGLVTFARACGDGFTRCGPDNLVVRSPVVMRVSVTHARQR